MPSVPASLQNALVRAQTNVLAAKRAMAVGRPHATLDLGSEEAKLAEVQSQIAALENVEGPTAGLVKSARAQGYGPVAAPSAITGIVPVVAATSAGDSVLDRFGGSSKLAIAGGVAAAALGATAVGIAVARAGSDKPQRRRSKRSTGIRRSTRKARRKRGRAHERFSGVTGSERQYKRKGGGTVKYTKHGQPYVLTRSGKAKFIKKSSRRRR